jgi:hypothetical protein
MTQTELELAEQQRLMDEHQRKVVRDYPTMDAIAVRDAFHKQKQMHKQLVALKRKLKKEQEGKQKK